MYTLMLVVQVVVSILLSLIILSQSHDAGLSATFGGGSGVKVQKRGAEKVLSLITIFLAVLFVGNSLAFIFI